MAGITMAGSGSGLDLESIITSFVSAEKMPKESRLNKKEVAVTTELSGVGTLKAALADFKATSAELGNTDSFFQSKTNIRYQGRNVEQTSADAGSDSAASPITIQTKGVVPKGAFDVEVKQIAQGARLESDFLPDRDSKPGQGMLYFDAGKNTFQVDVNITDTLQDIQMKINDAPDNYGISANVISSDVGAKIIYTSDKTGKENGLTVFTSDSSLNRISSSMVGQQATDAIITVDGNMITKDNNIFNHAVSGVTITANSLTNLNEPANFSTATDHAAVEDLVYGFVDGYNTLMDTINVLTNPETGVLKLDPTARSVKQQLQTITGGVVEGANKQLNTLYAAGISLEEGGMLSISPFGKNGGQSGTQRLNDAVSNSLDDLGKLFAGDNGIAAQVNKVLSDSLGNRGMISVQQDMLNNNLRDIEDDRIKLDEHISSFENTLRKKYTALDNTVTRYNATGDYIRNVLG
ncbi:flagellar filament capping protein FliD [Moritella sp. F3]|uniref:flagellar filament capping protein FliD n=1 Tax=Moritella sp. F3 TaxID=2718882 RepID=UPI0018E10545|nr:flagellar filament capping protein FliD [Moritella sp. F3]GIC76597.1 flagellar hook-associated protein 2 [Moritella sp. F1]GIC81650.1 flagellar hook-associated protein 2 [Moritella sp. F3]